MNEKANMAGMADIALAVDIGGTKIRAAAIGRDGMMLASTRKPTGAANGAAHVLGVIAESLDDLLKLIPSPERIVGIGLSSAGVIAPQTGRVVSSAPQIPGWAGTPLGEHFSQRYGLRVLADNDANCALLGEAWQGKHTAGADGTVVMLTLGTGLGGAIMVDGRLRSGHHHLTGHFGLARVWDPFTSRLVSVEALVSGTGLGNIYQRLHPQHQTATGEQVMTLALNVDPLANDALETWLDHLTLQLHNIYWMIDPDLIIIGGGMVDAREIWWRRLMQRLAAQHVASPITAAALGNDAGVVGAAKMVFDAVTI